MLKYFGLNEILYGLKKFAVWIVAITVVFGTVGVASASCTPVLLNCIILGVEILK